MKESTKVGFVLAFCFFIAWIDRIAINLTIPTIASELAMGSAEVGSVLGAFFLGYAICQIPGGLLCDKFGPRRVIMFSLIWWSLFTALSGHTRTYHELMFTRFMFGIGEGVFPACVWKMISGWYPTKFRATANALILSMIALGPAVTPLLIGPAMPLIGWRNIFYALGACGFLACGLAFRFLYDSLPSSPRVSQKELRNFEVAEQQSAACQELVLRARGFSDVLRSPTVWLLFANGLIMNIAMYGWLSWLPTYLMKTRGLDLKATVVASSVPFLFGAIGCMSAGYLSDRFFPGRRKQLVIICQVLGATSLYCFVHVSNPQSFLLLQSCAAFFLFMACGAIWSLPMVMLPASVMGTGSGFINMGGQLGGFITNLMIGHYIALRGGDVAAGFDIMLGALAISTLMIGLLLSERTRHEKYNGKKHSALPAMKEGKA